MTECPQNRSAQLYKVSQHGCATTSEKMSAKTQKYEKKRRQRSKSAGYRWLQQRQQEWRQARRQLVVRHGWEENFPRLRRKCRHRRHHRLRKHARQRTYGPRMHRWMASQLEKIFGATNHLRDRYRGEATPIQMFRRRRLSYVLIQK